MFCAFREMSGMTNSYAGRSFAARQKRRLIEKYDCFPGLVITRNEQQFSFEIMGMFVSRARTVAVSFVAFDRGQSSFVYRSYPVPSPVWSVICAANLVFRHDGVSAGDT